MPLQDTTDTGNPRGNEGCDSQRRGGGALMDSPMGTALDRGGTEPQARAQAEKRRSNGQGEEVRQAQVQAHYQVEGQSCRGNYHIHYQRLRNGCRRALRGLPQTLAD